MSTSTAGDDDVASMMSMKGKKSKDKKSKGSKGSKGSVSSASMMSMKGKKSKQSKKGKKRKNSPKFDAILSNVNCMTTSNTVTVTPTADSSAVIFTTSPNTEVFISQTLVDVAEFFNYSPPHNTAVVIDGGETAIITGTAFTTSGESSLEISYIQQGGQAQTPLSIYDSPVQCTIFIDFSGLDPGLGGYPTPIDTRYPFERRWSR
ncbi:hypothetical protein TrVE_jg345 [Triparma verrucosa]|uniref:Uncharacterized protein n=2 Tax=Triparma TaxID=722752 RepID=A0A9W7AJL3_9STRA|nr:hypothetical protein TrST_g4473 [Triparma strigata]GMH99692.1 hypothetical protein TrVE_jg345 [Triparma verrucosa]